MAGAAVGVLPTFDFDAHPTDLQILNLFARYARDGVDLPYLHHHEVYDDVPQDLARRFRPARASDGARCWLFLSHLKQRPGNSSRIARQVGPGTWVGERLALQVKDADDVLRGSRYKLSYVVKDPVSKKKKSQGWIMNEYSLPEEEERKLVLCMIYGSKRTEPVTGGPPLDAAAPLPQATAAVSPRPRSPPHSSPLIPHRPSPPDEAAHTTAVSPRPRSPPHSSPLTPHHPSPPDEAAHCIQQHIPCMSEPRSVISTEDNLLDVTMLHQDEEEHESHLRHPPSDQELVLNYLKPHLVTARLINTADVYRMHPADLTAKFTPAKLSHDHEVEATWYFFSVGSRGSRRWVDDGSGYWRSSFGAKDIRLGTDAIGTREVFNFLTKEHQPTKWNMLEIGLLDGSDKTKVYKVSCKRDGKRKRGSVGKTSGRFNQQRGKD